MSGEVSVAVRDLHVIYESVVDQHRSMQARIRERQFRRRTKQIHALRGVSFDLYRGETVGIMGANGSGKSTLLGALTGLIPIRSGSIRVRSRPTLLGVGAAMRPALSGRRNIMVGGVALGFTQSEIAERMDDIIAFSGLEDHIDLPMRNYSSGMKSRLAFSIATSIEPEILLIDEALAVGDRSFKARSLARLEAIRGSAGTVVLVSHSAGEMDRTDRVIWLHDGLIRQVGPPAEVVPMYDEFADAQAAR